MSCSCKTGTGLEMHGLTGYFMTSGVRYSMFFQFPQKAWPNYSFSSFIFAQSIVQVCQNFQHKKSLELGYVHVGNLCKTLFSVLGFGGDKLQLFCLSAVFHLCFSQQDLSGPKKHMEAWSRRTLVLLLLDDCGVGFQARCIRNYFHGSCPL